MYNITWLLVNMNQWMKIKLKIKMKVPNSDYLGTKLNSFMQAYLMKKFLHCCSSIFTSFCFWFRFCGYSPASSSEWGNRRSEVIHACGCFHSVSIPMRGDIVAFPSNHGTTHCGIVTTGGHFIGTTNKRIVETKMPAHVKRVFWRYTGDVPSTDRLLEKYKWEL